MDIRLRFAVRLAKLIFWVLLVCSLPNTRADHYVRVIPAVYPDETTTTTTTPPPPPVPVQVDVDSYFANLGKETTSTTERVMASRLRPPVSGEQPMEILQASAAGLDDALETWLKPVDNTEPPLPVTKAEAKEINDAIEAWARNVEADSSSSGLLTEELEEYNKLSVGSVPSPRTKRSLVQSSKMFDFKAYDCTVPADVTSVTMSPDFSCDLPDAIEHAENKTMTLLQRADHTRIEVRSCTRTRTKMYYLCNFATGHTTTIGKQFQFNRPDPVSPEECDRLWKDKMFHGQALSEDITNYVVHDEKGYHWSSGHDVHCKGEWGTFPNTDISGYWGDDDGMIVTHYEIKLEKHEALVDNKDDGMRLERSGLKLPCALEDEECETGEHGTYLWNEPKEMHRCPLYKARGPLHGVEILDSTGTTTFATTDGSHIRLTKGSPSSYCGAIVHATDFADLYLTTETHHTPFNRELPEAEVSVSLFSNVNDRFVFDTVTSDYVRALRYMREKQCEENREMKASRYAARAAEQGALMDGETAALGDGQFVTAAGEAWYQYRCKRIKVTARVDKFRGCYNALPVTLGEEDYKHYVAARSHQTAKLAEGLEDGDELEETDEPVVRPIPARDAFFLEPKTHRLLSQSLTRPCVPSLEPMYKNALGKWITYSGQGIRRAADPRTVEGGTFDLDDLPTTSPTSADWDLGGIYERSLLDRWELLTTSVRGGEAIAIDLYNKIIRNLKEKSNPQLNTVSDFFPSMQGLPAFVKGPLNFLQSFWFYVQQYGHICSILVGTAIILNLLKWGMNVAFRLFSAPVTANPFMHVVTAFFPHFRSFLSSPGSFCSRRCGVRAYQSPTSELSGRRQELMEKYAEETAERVYQKLREEGVSGAVDAARYPNLKDSVEMSILRKMEGEDHHGATAPLRGDINC